MKKRTIITVLTFALFAAILVMQSCKKEDENQLPACKITTPSDGQQFAVGDTVKIVVEASDNDGTVAKVDCYVNGQQAASATVAPYIFLWNTQDVQAGNYDLKATATDDKGGTASDQISITLGSAKK